MDRSRPVIKLSHAFNFEDKASSKKWHSDSVIRTDEYALLSGGGRIKEDQKN